MKLKISKKIVLKYKNLVQIKLMSHRFSLQYQAKIILLLTINSHMYSTWDYSMIYSNETDQCCH